MKKMGSITHGTRAYKAFARKQEYLFFGRLGGGYYQALYEEETRKNFSAKLQDRRSDLDRLLRYCYFEVGSAKVLEVSMESISASDKIFIKGQLRACLQVFLTVWNRFKSTTNDPYRALKNRKSLRSVLGAMR